jgi:F0F1-type ATP synthase assembly protein I
MIDHWPESSMLITIAISSSMDAVACVMKYLVAASVDHGLPLLINKHA